MSRILHFCRYSCLMMLLASSVALAAKDPTRPPGRLAVASGAEPIAATYQVGSVIIGGGRKLAVVNGQRVMIGDQVDGAKVVGIKADTVVLHVEGEYKRYTINKPLKKTWLKRDKN